MKKISLLFCSFLALTAFAPRVEAIGLDWNGFASVYGLFPLSKKNYPLGPGWETTGKPEFLNVSKFGLNLRSDLSPELAVIGQILAASASAARAGGVADWKLTVDWAHLLYNPVDPFTIRAGRQLYPAWLVSDFIDVGFAYPWRQPPIPVYDVLPFKSFTGLSAAYRFDLGSDLALTSSIFGGNGHQDLFSRSSGLAAAVDIEDFLGAVTSLDGDGWRLRAMAARVTDKVTSTVNSTVTGAPTAVLSSGSPGQKIFSVGGRYDKGKVLLYSEFAYKGTRRGTLDAATGTKLIRKMMGYYGTAGYRIGRFLPRYTYSYGNWLMGFAGGNAKLKGHNFGVNFAAGSNIVLKAEYDILRSDKGALLRMSRAGTVRSVSFGADVVF